MVAKMGNTPDMPNPTGTVSRVVRGVTIHPLNAWVALAGPRRRT